MTGLLTGTDCVLRLRTNMQVYWDQVFVAPLGEVAKPGGGRVPLPVRSGVTVLVLMRHRH